MLKTKLPSCGGPRREHRRLSTGYLFNADKFFGTHREPSSEVKRLKRIAAWECKLTHDANPKDLEAKMRHGVASKN
jgi:hypothetical protein